MSRTYVGVDVQPEGLYLAALQRGRPHDRLCGLRFESLEGVIEVSRRQPNVRDARRFVEGLRRGVDALAGQEERIALSLPDRAGRLYLTEIDTPFKNHAEGIDILKWRLKANLPAAPAQTQLDYQVLTKRDDGRQRCIVVAMARPVLEQYEDLINEAGRYAIQIDFHSLNLYNYYRPRLDPGDEFILVSLEHDLLGLQYVLGQTLCYQRTRACKLSTDTAFREITRTLVDAQTAFPGVKRCPVYAHLDPDQTGDFQALLTAVFERQVKILDPDLKRFSGEGQTGGLQPIGTVVAALGAAERSM